jgi:hypothetical protein
MVDLKLKERFPVSLIFMTSPNLFSNQNNFSPSDTGARRPRHESDHSLECIADIKNAWNFTSTLPRATSSWQAASGQKQFTILLH